MNARTHTHTRSNATSLLVLIASLLVLQPCSVSAMTDQQETPQLAPCALDLNEMRSVLNQGDEFLGTKDGYLYRFKKMFEPVRPDAADVVPLTKLFGTVTALGSGLTWCMECTGRYGCSAEFDMICLAAPVVISGLSYLSISNMTTLSFYKRALRQSIELVEEIASDAFLSDEVSAEDFEGYVLARFGIERGMLRAVEYYQGLHHKLESIQGLVREASTTRDEALKAQCAQLQNQLSVLSKDLLKKLAFLAQQKAEYKQQLKDRQQKEAQQRKEALQARKEQQRAAQLAAVMQNKNVQYAVNVSA